jgi:Flp pilus assembly protein TadG
MIDILVLIAVLFLGLGLGGVAVAAFFYVIDKMQNGGKK